jgi:hypothetical protein
MLNVDIGGIYCANKFPTFHNLDNREEILDVLVRIQPSKSGSESVTNILAISCRE